MGKSEQTISQYLQEAHATEVGLVRVLQSQIAMAPRGSYRTGLETHLKETRDHARRLEERLSDLGQGGTSLQGLVGFAESAIAQLLALGKTPLDLIRGNGGEEKVLKSAKDSCAAEALEIATYTALERLASELGDKTTAELAASIRAEEEAMLERLLRELPRLAKAVAAARVKGESSYDLSETGAADSLREAGQTVKRTARKAEGQARRTARGARSVPGVAQVEGQLKGAVASAGDLAIADYDNLSASEVIERLSDLSQIDLAKVDSYERRHQDRSTILGRLATLRGEEPWPGYDELTVDQIRHALAEGDDARIKSVRSYERSHKNRAGVLNATQREAANA